MTALAFLLQTVVLVFLGQLVAPSPSGDPLRVPELTPLVLPFNTSARVIRSSELESDNVSDILDLYWTNEQTLADEHWVSDQLV